MASETNNQNLGETLEREDSNSTTNLKPTSQAPKEPLDWLEQCKETRITWLAESIVQAHEKDKYFIVGCKEPPYCKIKEYYEGGELKEIKNPNIIRMEENCQVIKKLITRTDLNHLERNYLMFIYARAGNAGIERLKDIMNIQNNYNKRITDDNINKYLSTGKLYGISCQRLIEQGLCTHKECKNYGK